MVVLVLDQQSAFEKCEKVS